MDTVLVIVGAVLLTLLGQLVVGHLDLHGAFDPTPGPGHSATFPATMPLAGAFFVVTLQRPSSARGGRCGDSVASARGRSR